MFRKVLPAASALLLALGFGALLTQGAWIAAAVWFCAGLLLLDACWPRFDLKGMSYWRGPRKRKAVALTFDDGPDPRHTPELLDLLRALETRATFFLLGRHAREHPDLVRRILEEGHEIGNHGFSHAALVFKGPGKIAAEIRSWEEAVGEKWAPAVRWFRPPFGLKNGFVRKVAARLGYRIAAWSRDLREAESRSVETLVRRATAGIRGGEILALRDGDGPGRGAGRSRSVEAVGPIVRILEGKGFSFVTMSQLFPTGKRQTDLGRFLFGLFLSAAFTVYAIKYIDLKEVWRNLTVGAPGFLAVALFLDAVCVLLKSQGWRELVLPLAPIRRLHALAIFAVGGMLNQILPLRGGDLGRADLLGRREEVRRLHGYSTVVLEGVVSGLSFLPILVVSIAFFPLPDPLRKAAVYFAAGVLGALLVTLLVARKSDHRYLEGFGSFREKRRFGSACLLFASAWIVYLAALACTFRACGLEVSLWASPVVALTLALSMFVPSGVARLGPYEGAVVASLSFFGVKSAQALAFALILHTAQTLPALFGGALAWLYIESAGKRPHPQAPRARQVRG